MVLLQSPSSRAVSTLLLPVVDTPSGGGGSVVLEPVRPPAQPTRRLVYSCATPGHVTFSDRPCGPAPQVRELKVAAPAPVAAGAVPDLAKARQAPPATTRPTTHRETDDASAGVDEHAMTCGKLRATLDDVDARMRAGYSAREAGRLWERWREAKARLHEANC
jgi:hypothetical protein